MADSLDVFRYISYLRSRWRLIGVSCAIAVTIAVAVSLIMPRQYTATARIVIEPPAGSDPRGAMAVSPIYLESLRTYEHFASSDSLFQKAIDQFGLRASLGARPLESLKRKILKVGLVRNTRILEIACTLPDAQKAHALASFLAQAAVDLNRSLTSAGDESLLQGMERQARDARARGDEIEAAWTKLAVTEPVEELQNAMKSAVATRASVQQMILSAQLELADSADREKQASPAEKEQLHKDQSNSRARLEQMRQQLQALDRQAVEREGILAARIAHREKLEAERTAALAALTAAESRLRQARSDEGFRGERLEVFDPGVVPERPSSPNLPLNVLAALLLGLLLPMLYLAVELSFQEQRAGSRRGVFHALARARDE